MLVTSLVNIVTFIISGSILSSYANKLSNKYIEEIARDSKK